ncbi:E3 ubiquitin-protein ligase RMA1H1 [Apostasia shenzhenica]|uniref:E3 ubiquitin-protein ligase RMA1H1 n=1 Tax=Apostasia shenzhenica TaxID=1088818 RepID=A0A2H9ZWB4_9ASPA|nr:E3 ubiquitin-protein ligase RMA1H1 [Apostasia shenzhenica]
MSISPTDGQSSLPNSSTRDNRQNPTSSHGFLSPQQDRSLLGSHTGGPCSTSPGLAQVWESPLAGLIEVPGSNDGNFEKTSGISDIVKESKGSNAKKHSSGQKGDTYFQHQSSGGGCSSQFRFSRVGPQTNGRPARSPHNRILGSNGFQTSATQATARRSQVTNANHLLNFHYEVVHRSHPQQRVPALRRPQRIKPYNKDLFLQANYKFVVYDTGNYSIESIDPDKMFPWEDVVCLRYSSPFPVNCPICLESPLCPQITSCGHIYCFPCILRYLLMGMEDNKGESWKKCPLCFMMISSKDLYSVIIDQVKQFHVGDHADFVLLTRPKDSLIPLTKHQEATSPAPCGSDNSLDVFSKFVLTSDIELSVRDAKAHLSNWICKAEAGIIDDMEKLPYVCAALEHLEERMKSWMENLNFFGSPPLANCSSPLCIPKADYNPSVSKLYFKNSSLDMENFRSDTTMGARSPDNGVKHESAEVYAKRSNQFSHEKPAGSSVQMYNEDKILSEDLGSSNDARGQDSYNFYQVVDGQLLILHPLSMKCLLHHYGSYDMLPPRLSGQILELEAVTQSEAMRKRYRYLSHFPLTTTFQLCEIDLTEILPPPSLSPFMEEIRKRDKQRKRIAKKPIKHKRDSSHRVQVKDQKAKAEAASAAEVATLREMLNPSNQRYLTNEDTIFSLDEFEALGGVPASSQSTAVQSERKLFSSVTRLGFAAAHDSPALGIEDSAISSGRMDNSQASGAQGVLL